MKNQDAYKKFIRAQREYLLSNGWSEEEDEQWNHPKAETVHTFHAARLAQITWDEERS
ncbi:MAG TPA: hypothetical protein VFA98_12790 [Thermoanaerobaculia bacterium]|nr:hypothetical protein [Thermoanaerobaculia bacterium]